ncbi:MAG TPA: hypothetical protein VF432_04700 [Thermoanaerobaculia bacterium]
MINWRNWLDKWGMSELKINAYFLEMKWEPKDGDRDAAWELYAELLTRVTTQALSTEHGDEKAALDSVYSIFPTTREIMKRRGRHAVEFTKIAVVVLNQIIRPFTAKWHKGALAGAFTTPAGCEEFRADLARLQPKLIAYAHMLSDMAGVEDLTELEEPGSGPLPRMIT